MDLSLLFQYARVLIKEIWLHRFLVVTTGGIVSLIVLGVGTQWPVKYQTSMMIFADNENILRPLLANQASVTQVENQVKVVKDVMLSPRILRQTVELAMPEVQGALDVDQAARLLRAGLDVRGVGNNHIRVSYQNSSANKAFKILNTVTDLFIKDSSESQRKETRQAFEFIDKQVAQYKEQLVEAESKLKAFQSANTDGSEANVDSSITKLRGSIETMKLDLEEANTRIRSLKKQMSQVDPTTGSTQQNDVYRLRLVALMQKKDALLLQYRESHPDIVSINLQINEMKDAIRENADRAPPSTTPSEQEQALNPFYKELRLKLDEAEVEVKARERRLASTQKLLAQEFERRKRVAAREAELAELTRDYNVTRNIYEEMLESKEKARLSMSLSSEGQGVTYKIQEPAVFPNQPSGLRFIHFAVLGVLAGIGVPLGVLFAYVILDPRIRFHDTLASKFDIPVLVDIPHTKTAFSRRVIRTDAIVLGVLSLLFISVYVFIGLAYRSSWFGLGV